MIPKKSIDFLLLYYRFEVKNNWNDLDVITIDDELEALT